MNIKSILQSLYYISDKLNKNIDKLTALKLIFFADKYHLIKYGRTVTDDLYYAMPHGPVASHTKEILDFNPLDKSEKKTINKFIKLVNKNRFSTTQKNLNLDFLSDTDKEALDFSIKNFGKKFLNQGYKISEVTHKYPEWKQYESTLTDKKNKTTRIFMDLKDFFSKSDDENDPFNIFDDKQIKLSKEDYLGLL